MDTRHRWALGLAVAGGAAAYVVCVAGLTGMAGWRLELAVGVGLVAAVAVEAGAFVWRMGRPARGGTHACTGAEGLLGQPCTALTALAPDGLVRVHGEIWRARLTAGGAVEPGRLLRVASVDGLRLVVSPEAPGGCE